MKEHSGDIFSTPQPSICSPSSTPSSLYIHWPFCKAKCPYCDFNSHVRASIDEERWHQSLLQELEFVGQESGKRSLISVFFGGGTPSLMPPRTVAALLDKLGQYWTLAPDLEVTLEANPNSVEASKFKDFRAAGINRVSLGIQALQDSALKFLGRIHGRDEALAAINTASTIFERYSFDLIYARPNQTITEWREELSEALHGVRQHISLYQLTIEPGTAFHTAHKRGDWQIPDENLAAQFYEVTQEMLETAGLPAYEVSNHARPGFECQHNLTYWRYQDYTCIGPGAHGRVTLNQQKYAVKNYHAPETWLNAVAKDGHGREEAVLLNPSEQLIECLMMGLRLKEGIPYNRLEGITGKAFNQIFQADTLSSLFDEGYLLTNSNNLQLSPAGLQRLNAILEYLSNRTI
jgi:putative oxygen-independent coproporphyrinogen III oxidase